MAEENQDSGEKKSEDNKMEYRSDVNPSPVSSHGSSGSSESSSGGGDFTINLNKDQMWKYSTFILAAVVIIVAFFAFGGDGGSPPTGAVVGAPKPPHKSKK